MRKATKGAKTYKQILETGVELARETHVMVVTASLLAQTLGIAESTVRLHLGNRKEMRDAIIEEMKRQNT